MNENEKLLLRLLRRIHAHGYYHHVDVALVEWFTSNAKVSEVCAKYDISPMALYKHRSRLRRQEVAR